MKKTNEFTDENLIKRAREKAVDMLNAGSSANMVKYELKKISLDDDQIDTVMNSAYVTAKLKHGFDGIKQIIAGVVIAVFGIVALAATAQTWPQGIKWLLIVIVIGAIVAGKGAVHLLSGTQKRL